MPAPSPGDIMPINEPARQAGYRTGSIGRHIAAGVLLHGPVRLAGDRCGCPADLGAELVQIVAEGRMSARPGFPGQVSVTDLKPRALERVPRLASTSSAGGRGHLAGRLD